jgi:ribonuclease HI
MAYQALTQDDECGHNRPWQMLFQRRRHAAEVLGQPEDSWDTFKVEFPSGEPREHIPSGTVYTDGSGLHPRHGICRRAGWGVHGKACNGDTTAVHGAVPRPLPQTATVAEVTALCQTMRLMERGATVSVVTDCQAVVNGFEAGPNKLRAGRRHAGVWRNIWRTIHEKQLQVTIQKTKAHRSEKEARAQQDMADYLGNQEADRLAGQGARLIGPPESAVSAEIRLQAGEKTWVKAMATHVPDLWRRGGEAFPTRPGKKKDKVEPTMRCRPAGYVGGELNKWWWCDRCGRNSQNRAKLCKNRCPGQDRLAAISIANHHDTRQWTVLSGTWQGKTLWGCSTCGSTGIRRAEGLGRPCRGTATGHRKWVLAQLGKGRHPNGKDVVEECQRVSAPQEAVSEAAPAHAPSQLPPETGWEQGLRLADEFWVGLPQEPDTLDGCSPHRRGPSGPEGRHPQSGGQVVEQPFGVAAGLRRHGLDSSEADSQSEPSELDVSDLACWAEPPVLP